MIEQQENYKNVKDSNYNVYSKTFMWMFMGLLLTAIISWFTYSSGLAFNLLSGNMFTVMLILELVAVLIFSLLLKKVSPTVAGILFFVYAAINGITLSTIFLAFNISSIVMVFFASALLFGIFAFVGYKTNIDLTKVGTILLGVVFIGIILSIINLFIGNTIFDLILCWVLLFVFFGITAYDMQKIKRLALNGIYGDKLHIYGAMELYLDFINIFVRLLSIFGRNKD